MTTIVCWKWDTGRAHPKKGIRFSAEHVNRLYRMVERNCRVAFRFVCVTDDHKGIGSWVEVINADRHFPEPEELPRGGCWRRLRAFDLSTALALFGPGRFLSLDLDVVVTGDLTPVVEFQEDFRIWEDKYRRKTPYCGSLWGMRPGARQKVWDGFRADPAGAAQAARDKGLFGTDQAWIAKALYPHAPVWTEKDGVYNFNTRVRRQVRGVERLHGKTRTLPALVTGEPPENSRLVFFNGKYDPSHEELQKRYAWIGDLWR